MKHLNVMFVCLGNICRSPLAEAIFKNLVSGFKMEDQFHIESCGTAGYHIGDSADPRSAAVARKHNIPMNHSAQQLSKSHFDRFDYIIVMDDSNLENTLKLAPEGFGQIYKMKHFDEISSNTDVDDPYFGGDDGFELCFQELDNCCANLLQFIVSENKLT